MKLSEKANIILNQLKKEYPIVRTPLNHSSAFELLVATILSPQTMDITTNKVTPNLFEKYPTPEKLSVADYDELDQMIKLVNYHKTKARNLIKTARLLVENFNSQVPMKMQDLITLAGVGRKVANVIISEWFVLNEGIEPEGFVVDTHVIRVSNRLGFVNSKDPYQVEKALMDLIPKSEWPDTSLRFIFHGRNTCKPKPHLCCEHEFWSQHCNCIT